ncbi:hypothetical protein EOD39_6750 [Acipenser ruthenus]|uniref:Uncharacterized protein n=1 Tax=Acipenser ruthenus TaxID=7906 RepID=A0A444U964_ACIRT|nr:hypothetical protein EOD39_6750 [Acipenser ruthenus]
MEGWRDGCRDLEDLLGGLEDQGWCMACGVYGHKVALCPFQDTNYGLEEVSTVLLNQFPKKGDTLILIPKLIPIMIPEKAAKPDLQELLSESFSSSSSSLTPAFSTSFPSSAHAPWQSSDVKSNVGTCQGGELWLEERWQPIGAKGKGKFPGSKNFIVLPPLPKELPVAPLLQRSSCWGPSSELVGGGDVGWPNHFHLIRKICLTSNSFLEPDIPP